MSPAMHPQKLSTFARIKMPDMIRVTYKAIRMTCCMLHNVYCIPGYLLLNLLMLPLYYISIEAYSWIENILYYALLYIVGWWGYGGGLIVHEHGDDIHQLLEDNNPNIRVLVVANHQSTADVPLMFQAFSARSSYSLLWIMDRAFKWTNFGLVSQVHGDYFIDPKNYVPDSIANHCQQRYSLMKNMIIIFPEGGFRYKRLQSSIAFATKRNYPIMCNVTYPRVNGFRELLKDDVNITHVVDLTICYDDPDKVPSILDIVRGINYSGVHFHYKIHQLNGAEENINSEEWLYEQWQKKEALLNNHYTAIKRKQQNHPNDLSIDSNKSSSSGDDHVSCGLSSVKHQEQQSLLRKRNDISPIKPSNVGIGAGCCDHLSPDNVDSSNHSHNNNNNNNQHPSLSPETQATTTTITAPLSASSESVLKFRSHHEFQTYRFDLNQGRPVRFSFFRTLFYHLGYLFVCLMAYAFIAVLIVPTL
ncbi:acyl-coa:lysophosphatidylglycerol acyltransferase 1-like protein [Dermatophagoides farinae]|uniref:Acyl-coa:lysophosphatidylglycerol acyltransferase 1-like protein n=1 Tax=Dermatophagoides farinae TaxID=6954 RepID=A0A9D4SE56_DERFA|nr:acyl-CoA:lysophosphatidylglycerol acyltransferase 1-like [Dermatophagoides farinae]KAH7638378.1 acyl-coa:lysophosphatidylglycerol acyltransferase 1-like protein [Dermatophagoides farinae]